MKKFLMICAFFLSINASAGEIKDFSQETFEQLQKDNASILIDVYATWCPTCRKQGKVIKKYLKQNPESDLVVLKVNYDEQKPWVKYFKAPRQSTLVMYKGDKMLARSIAQTNEKKLFNLFSMTK